MSVRTLLVAALLALPLAALPAASTAPERWELPLVTAGFSDTAVLAPYDPRAPALAAQAPALADGLWTGHLAASGGLVRVVQWGDESVALAQVGAGLAWFTLDEGRLVPLAATAEPETLDVELRALQEAPQATALPAAAVASPRDGRLQILLDADRTFTNAWNVLPGGAARGQLAIVSLVDVIYRTSLGVEIEVVEQHQRTQVGNYTGQILCDSSPSDLLAQFRDAWEAERPTTSDLRESALIFTSKVPAPHPSGSGTLIGCAYVYELETSYAYASARIQVPTNFATAMTQEVPLVAHEIGHNFGGLHHRAMPTPDGPLDIVTCNGATVMYPFLCRNAPVFSDTRDADPFRGVVELALEGGNAPWMESYAESSI